MTEMPRSQVNSVYERAARQHLNLANHQPPQPSNSSVVNGINVIGQLDKHQ